MGQWDGMDNIGLSEKDGTTWIPTILSSWDHGILWDNQLVMGETVGLDGHIGLSE